MPAPPRLQITGTVSMTMLRDLLAQRLQLKDAKVAIRASQGPHNPSLPVALLFERYSSNPTCLKIVRSENCGQMQPALLLTVEQERWTVAPYLLHPEFLTEDGVFAVAIQDRWIDVSLRYVEEVFNDVAASNAVPIVQEKLFESKNREFRRHGPGKFFPSIAKAVRWVISSHWDDWNRLKKDWKARRIEVEKLGFPIDLRHFKRISTRELNLEYLAARAKVGPPSPANLSRSAV